MLSSKINQQYTRSYLFKKKKKFSATLFNVSLVVDAALQYSAPKVSKK